MPDTPAVTVGPRRNVIAGEYRHTATVTYLGESPQRVTFQSSDYGPPIVMLTDSIPGGTFISSRVLDRCGRTLDAAWILRFFGVTP